MNKKLFILMFLIMASPVFANDNPFRDEVINEQTPSLIGVETTTTQKTSFVEKLKDIFTRDNKDMAKEVDVVSPTKDELKTIDFVKEEQKQKEKEVKKQQKQVEKEAKEAAKKLEKEAKEAEKLAKKEAKVLKNSDTIVVEEKDLVNNSESVEETEAVLTDEEKTTLTNTAYQGNVTTTKIMQVDECVKIALEKHPLIHLAMSTSEVYKSRIAQAWANYFPTFSAGVSYSRNDMQVANFAFPTQKYDMFYTPTISGNMLLFDFGKTKAQADLAKRTYESSKFALQNSINTVIFGVKQAYYNLLFAQQQVKVYEDTVADYTLHLEQAKAYYDIGTKAKIDVLTAEHNLGKAKLGLIQAKNTLEIAYVQLSNAMGTPDASDYDVTDNLTTKAYSIAAETAVNTAFETSPEL